MNFKPIFLASTGRAGSTLMMKVLSLHRQILARQIFPYEARAFQYYYLCDRQGEKHPTFLPIKLENVEYRPFQGNDKESVIWSEKNTSLVVEEYGANLTEKYYRFVSEIEEKPEAMSFVEKAIGLDLIKSITQFFHESQVIFLRRDPRDTFFSIKSFNQKRGFLSFGEEAGDEAMFSGLISYYKETIIFAKTLGARAITIRYEDLISSKDETLSCLFKKLKLDYSNLQINNLVNSAFDLTKEVKNHRTTEGEKTSLARWKREANSETIEMFEKFKDVINTLGYEEIELGQYD